MQPGTKTGDTTLSDTFLVVAGLLSSHHPDGEPAIFTEAPASEPFDHRSESDSATPASEPRDNLGWKGWRQETTTHRKATDGSVYCHGKRKYWSNWTGKLVTRATTTEASWWLP